MFLSKKDNLYELVAWKNDRFDFGMNTDIYVVMRQLARWYDMDIEFQEGLKARVGGGISKKVNGLKVLEMLEKTGVVKFKINGKKITVMSPS